MSVHPKLRRAGKRENPRQARELADEEFDELSQFQQRFTRSGEKPAATVVRGPPTIPNAPRSDTKACSVLRKRSWAIMHDVVEALPAHGPNFATEEPGTYRLLPLMQETLKSVAPHTETAPMVVEKDIITLDELPQRPPQESDMRVRHHSGAEPFEGPPRKKSRFAVMREHQRTAAADHDSLSGFEALDAADTHITVVLNKIQEHDPAVVSATFKPPAFRTSAFPEVLTVEQMRRRMQEMSKRRAASRRSSTNVAVSSAVASQISAMDIDSEAARSQPDAHAGAPKEFDFDEIHRENLQKLASMSSQEIEAAQKEIAQSLRPSHIELLKRRGALKDSTRIPPPQILSDIPSNANPPPTTPGIPNPNLSPLPDDSLLPRDPLELQKLQWITHSEAPSRHIPGFSPSTLPTLALRFDFDGAVIERDRVDIPVTAGLHHHGEEADAAGYSLKELYVLARSANASQRTIAARTLAAVLRRAANGEYFQRSPPVDVCGQLIDRNVAVLARCLLDDTNTTVIAAAVELIAALLVSPRVDTVFETAESANGPHGFDTLPLAPFSESAAWSAEDGELDVDHGDNELTDGERTRADSVAAMTTRMGLLARLRYVLEVCRADSAVESALAVLQRIARHSPAAANEIVRCPRLVDGVIRTEFIEVPRVFGGNAAAPVAVETSTPTQYGRPHPAAVKLVRVLCQSGRGITGLLAKSGMIGVVMRYVALGLSASTPDDETALFGGVSPATAQKLFSESVKVWRVVIGYGPSVGFAVGTAFVDMFPLMAPLLAKVVDRGDIDVAALAKAKVLFDLFESLVRNAVHSIATQVSTSANVLWPHVAPLVDIAAAVVVRMHERMTSECAIDKNRELFITCTQLMASAMHFLASYYYEMPRWPQYVPADALPIVERTVNTVINKIAEDPVFMRMSAEFPQLYRVLAEAMSPCRQRRAEKWLVQSAIPSFVPLFGALSKGDFENRFYLYGHWLSGFIRWVDAARTVHKGVSAALLNMAAKQFVVRLGQLMSELAVGCYSNHCRGNDESKQEALLGRFPCRVATATLTVLIRLLHELDQWAAVAMETPLSLATADEQRMALLDACAAVATQLLPGDEVAVIELLDRVLFDVDMLAALTRKAAAMNADVDIEHLGRALDVSLEISPLKRNVPHLTPAELRAVLLPFFRETVIVPSALSTSNALAGFPTAELTSYCLPVVHSALPLPPDWLFLPIALPYEQIKRNSDTIANTTELLPQIQTFLEFLVLAERAGGRIGFGRIPRTRKLFHLAKIFLLSPASTSAAADVAFDPIVAGHLASLLQMYTTPGIASASECEDEFDFAMAMDGVGGNTERGVVLFQAFLEELLEQFMAGSYGQSVFAGLLSMFLRTAPPNRVEFRKLLWSGAVTQMLHLIRPPSERKPPLGLVGYLWPAEPNGDLRRLYARALYTAAVTPQKNAFVYWLAVHHIAAGLQGKTTPPTSEWERVETLRDIILQSADKQVVLDVVNYRVPEQGTTGMFPPAPESMPLGALQPAPEVSSLLDGLYQRDAEVAEALRPLVH